MHPVETTAAPSEPPGPGTTPRRSAWWVAAGLAVTVAAAVHVFLAWRADSPAFHFDEVDTLLLGRVVLGLDVPQPTGGGYYPGWSLLLAPLWWLTSDPFVFYRVANVVGVVLALASIWPLARIATRLGVTPAQGVVAGAVVVTLPARAVQSGYALSEQLVFPLVACTILAGFRLWERPSYARAALLGALAALTLLAHARMLVLVAVVAVWLLVFAVRHWRSAAVGLGSLAVLSWGADAWAKHLNARLIEGGFTQETALWEQLAQTTPGLLLRTGSGEAWIQVVGSFSLAAVGLVAAVAMVGTDLRRRRVGPAALVLLAALGLYAASALNWADDALLHSRDWHRLDVWIYGRYADPVVGLLVLVGLCAVIRGLPRAHLAWSIAVAVAVTVPTLLVVAPEAPTWGFVTPAHIPGAMPWWWTIPAERFPAGLLPSLTNDNRFWLLASLTAAVPLAALVVLVLARRRTVLVVPLVLALAAAGSVLSDAASAEYRDKPYKQATPVIHTLRDVLAEHPGTEVSYDARCPGEGSRATNRNALMWWLLPTIVRAPPQEGDDVVIACAQGRPSRVPGAVPLPGTVLGDRVVWIMPGELQDDLRTEGALP